MENNTELYKCANCGILNESENGPPKSCIKCDCERLYRVKK